MGVFFDDVGFSTSFSDLNAGLFGTDAAGKQSGSSSSEGTAEKDSDLRETTQFRVNRAAIDKTIKDILSSNQGLADILQEEQGAGLFNSTVAQDAIGELIAKVAGEIGKLEGTTTRAATGSESITESQSTRSKTKTKSDSDGLFDSLNPFQIAEETTDGTN